MIVPYFPSLMSISRKLGICLLNYLRKLAPLRLHEPLGDRSSFFSSLLHDGRRKELD